VLGGAAAVPLATRAQEQPRRVGVLLNTAESNTEGQARFAAFRQGLRDIGWSEDSNVRIDVRWGGGDLARIRTHAQELVALSPDVLLAYAGSQLAALSSITTSIPIVFIGVSDPVTPGYVKSFARPGGNITGFTLFEAPLGGKWLATLKEVAPATTRVAIMANPDTAVMRGRLFTLAFESSASALAIEPVTADVRSIADIEATIARLGQRASSGLIVVPESFTSTHRELIVQLAAQHRVPAIYPLTQFTSSGGLMSYGPDNIDTTRRSVAYIDRILHGEKPAVLPVQAQVKYRLVINLKTARALGLTIPATLLARADEVIE
jgi:putative ABC transport system substrate-binding protein